MSHRYLYCLVDATDGPEHLDATGVDDEPVRVVTHEGIGAVVHECSGLYDSDDLATIRGWLLDHQSVVDSAMAAFGTPLPVRFDTVLEGEDAAVVDWIDGVDADLRSHLDRLDGQREYHVTLRWDPSGFEDRALERDERLSEIEAARADADGGAGFLREKQFEERLRELRASHERDLEATLLEAIDPVVSEWADAAETGSGSIPEGSDEDDDLVDVTRKAVLAPRSQEDDLGAALDEVVAEDGVEVKFTGPWPPYTFTPTLGGNQ